MFRERCHIIHDGVDLKKFVPGKQQLEKPTKTVTYGTRGMEPIRAFPQFINSLLPLLKANTDLVAEIAGEDSIHYGGNAPQGFASWGKWAALEELQTS